MIEVPATTLRRLRDAADEIRRGWRPPAWTRVSGPGPDVLEMRPVHLAHPYWAFDGIALERGTELIVRCPLELPDRVGGVAVEGDPLQVMLLSLFPTTLSVDGRPLLEETMPVVATGPALVEAVPSSRPGANGDIELTVSIPEHQLGSPWVFLHFSTPGTRSRFEVLDLAWAQLRLAETLAVTPEERKDVERAAQLVPDVLLGADDESLAASLQDMAEALSSLDERARALEVHLIGHSHIDLAWMWPWSDTVEVIKRDVRSVLTMLDDYPEMRFTHSQPAGYEVIRTQEPELFERIRAHVRSGRWEPATMQWVESDTNLVSGEAMARQLLEGVRYTREHFGLDPGVLFAPDTFGHAGTLPQLASSAGARAYYHHRANPGRYREPADMWPAYWWEGADGSRVMAVSTPTYNGHITAGQLVAAALDGLRHGHRSAMHFYGVGDHGGGPTRQSLDLLRRLSGQRLLPSARCSTVSAYVEAIESSPASLPVHIGESATMFEGCYTTHADTKRYNRLGENLLATADTLDVLAGTDHAAALRDAWQTVCFNQFHDIIAGSAIRDVYADHAADFARVSGVAEQVIDEALEVLQDGRPSGGIAVSNPLGWDREDLVVVAGGAFEGRVRLVGEHGHETWAQPGPDGLCFVARVPAFATVVYEIAASGAEAPVALVDGAEVAVDEDPQCWVVDTPFFRAHVRRNSGIIVGLLDKRVGRQLVGYGLPRLGDDPRSARSDLALNVFQVLDEEPHGMTSWDFDEVRTEESLISGATTNVVESGPVRLVLGVERRVRSSTITQRLSFYRDLARIDMDVSVDWQERGGPDVGVPNLKVAFTADLDETEAWFEAPFGATRRPPNGQEVPALRWADVGGPTYGMAVLNGCTYGHDALGTRLRLHLLRTAYDPDEASDLGRHRFTYSLVPHPGDWRDAEITRQAAGFNQPLLARSVAPREPRAGRRARPWQPMLPSGTTIILSGLKRAHGRSGTVIRLHEGAGLEATTALSGLPPTAPVWEANVVEDRLRRLQPVAGRLPLTFRPWEIRTLIVDDV